MQLTVTTESPKLCKFRHDAPTPATVRLICCPEDSPFACDQHMAKWGQYYTRAIRL